MDVRLPDGTVVTGIPDGISKADLTNKLMANGYAKSLASAEDRAMADPTRSMGGFERFRAGYGKAASDLGRGAAQLVGVGDQAAIDESRKLDAPLMNTAGGFAGNVAGTFANAMPALAIPGANTVAGAAAIGAGQGALQPVETGGSRALNTAVGAGAGAVGQAAGTKIANVAGNAITNMAARQGQNSVRDATLEAGRKAGLVAPPSAIEPGFWTNRLEGIAGKAALGQQASHKNQETVNQMVRAELGIPANHAISMPALKGIRTAEGKAYADVAALNKNAADALEELGKARSESTIQWNHYKKSGKPEALAKAKAADADKALWENFLEQEAIASGKQDLLPALRAARTRIAKTHDVERALNTSTGDVDSQVLARAVDHGKPLTGNLETIGRFADAFPRAMVSGAPAAGVSKLEGGLAALLATGGYYGGGPEGTALGLLPLLASPARGALLSGVGQRMLAGAPNYQPGMATQLLARPELAPGLAALLPAAAIPASR